MIEDLCSGLNCSRLDGLAIFVGVVVVLIVVGLAWGAFTRPPDPPSYP